MSRKSMLFNPQIEDFSSYDEQTKAVLKATVDFFEDKGLNDIRIDAKKYIWQADWMRYQKKHGIYKTMLTAKGYGDEGSRYDLRRITEINEILGFYGEAYQYPMQVSILGVNPIWMSDNEKQKHELAQQLKDGHVFAFGMSEKDYGADLYAMISNVRPTEDGYIANGNKYYIGNAHVASKVATLGKNIETDEWCFWVVDSRNRHYNYVKDIETPSINQARVGEYEMIEYPLTEDDILTTGDQAFANGLASVNIGKFQLGFSAVGIATHAFYEAITHSNRRKLYGNKVTDFPHVKEFLCQSFCRTNAMKLYALRSRDYFREMSDNDRRYLLFNPIQKMKVTTQGGDVVRLLMDVVCAKGYENDTYISDAYGTMDYLFRLEGTAHVNMGLVIRFMQNYFFNNIDYPEIGIITGERDDVNIFNQTMGGLSSVKFNQYNKVYEGVEIANVKIFADIVEKFREYLANANIDPKLMKNMDYMLNIGEIFTTIVYGQLVLEGALLNDVDEELINQIFKYFIDDINKYALLQLNQQHNTEVQADYLRTIALMGREVNKELDEKFWKEFVEVHDGAYVMNESVIGSDFQSSLV